MENKSIRTFIALDLPREVINEIERIQSLLKKQIRFRCKYTECENLHLTLKFLGELQESLVEKVQERLSEVKIREIKVKLGKIGFFQSRQSYVIWIELNNRLVKELQNEIDDKLRLFFPKEKRFMGHITIVRAKKLKRLPKDLVNYLQTIKPKPIEFVIDKFFLKKSELFEEGPVYSDIQTYSLLKE